MVYEPKNSMPGYFRATQLGTDALAQGAVERVIRGDRL